MTLVSNLSSGSNLSKIINASDVEVTIIITKSNIYADNEMTHFTGIVTLSELYLEIHANTQRLLLSPLSSEWISFH